MLPSDCIAWNNWSPDWSDFQSASLNEPYDETFELLTSSFAQVIDRHPIIAAGEFLTSNDQVLRLSDFESERTFRNNPLFCEIYRYLDSKHQVTFAPVVLTNTRVSLTFNRSGRDFSDLEMEVFTYIGLRLARVATSVEQRQQLEGCLMALCKLVGEQIQLDGLQSMSRGDLLVVTALLQGRSLAEIAATTQVHRNTIDKRLSAIRERLNLDHNKQLLCALAELRVNNPSALAKKLR